MRVLIASLLLASSFLSVAGITVTDSGLSFSLETVKILKTLMDTAGSDDLSLPSSTTTHVCVHPQLPAEFSAVCQRDDRDRIFSNLVDIITSPDPCEICANVACTGCF